MTINCTMINCKRNNAGRCTESHIVLSAYPTYIPLAKQFNGTLRCMSYRKWDTGELGSELQSVQYPPAVF